MATQDLTQRDARFQIRIRGLHKRFGEHHVLRGVDLDLERHKINIIIGGSGQGKSVLLKHLMGLIQPDEGAIYVDGVNIVGLPEARLNQVRRKFGMLFQYAALFDSMTVEENVAFPLVEHTRLPRRRSAPSSGRSSTPSGCATSSRSSPPSCLGACASAWGSRGPSCWSPRS